MLIRTVKVKKKKIEIKVWTDTVNLCKRTHFIYPDKGSETKKHETLLESFHSYLTTYTQLPLPATLKASIKNAIYKKELTVLVNGFLTFNGREEELAAVHVLRDVNQLIWGTEGSAWLPLRCLEASGIMRPSGEHIRPQGVRLNHSHHCCAGTRNEQQCVRYHKWTSKWCVTPTGMPVGHHTGWVCWWYVTKKGTVVQVWAQNSVQDI